MAFIPPDIEAVQVEAFALGQSTGILLKYGYKDLAAELYKAAYDIMARHREEQSGTAKAKAHKPSAST